MRILQLERRLIQLQVSHIGIRAAQKNFLIPNTPNLRNLTYAAKAIADDRGEKPQDGYKGYNVILYADPPLQTELYQASKTYLQERCGMTYLLTSTLLPFWNVTEESIQQTPNKLTTGSFGRKKKINISISEHDRDLKRRGLTTQEMNSFVVQMAQALVANEGIVCLGHDWREDGVMQEIYRFGEEHQDVVLSESDRQGMIENYCFWGQQPGLGDREQEILKGILDIIKCSRPDDPTLNTYESLSDIPEELQGYARARSLTTMRREMTEKVFARVCLGGRDMDPDNPENAPTGRCPGVLEEALMSCLANQPLYLSGLLGGVIQQAIYAIEGVKTPHLEFDLRKPQSRKSIVRAYEEAEKDSRFGIKPDLNKDLDYEQIQSLYQYDGLWTTDEILQILTSYGIERLSQNNGLAPEENRCLFYAATFDEVLGWVLTGLARLLREEITSKP